MRVSRTRLLCCLALAVAIAASPAAAGRTSAADAGPGASLVAAPDAGNTSGPGASLVAAPDAGNRSGPVVTQNATVAPDPRRGYVRVNLSYRVGSDAASLVTFDSPWAEVVRSHGFSEQPNGRWLWDESTDGPWLSMRVFVNRTSPRFGGYAWCDTGSWSLVRPPRGFAFYSHNDSEWVNGGVETPLIERELRVDGQGYAGVAVAYLGNYTTLETNDTDHRIRMIVPESATLEQSPERALGVLDRTASLLDVGGAPEQVNVFVGPEPMRDGGLTGGVSDGTADVWIAADEPLGAPSNIWIHEYVHTRQRATLGPEMRWFREASASYYAGLLSVRQGLGGPAGFDRFVDRLHAGTNGSQVLTNRSTWASFMTPYRRGQRVLAALDARIRERSGGNRTLMTVFRQMNERESVTYDEFVSIANGVSEDNVSEWLSAHVAAPRAVDPPDSAYAYVHPGGAGDADGDGLDSARERALGTNPFDSDSDGDGVVDGVEAASATDPLDPDTDGDGYADGTEIATGASPTNPFSVPHGTLHAV